MRTVSSATLTAAGKPVTRPFYLVQIEWPSGHSRLCTYGTLTWNGMTWSGSPVEVGGFTDEGLPTTVTLVDPDYAWRTLMSSNDGVRDKIVRVWKGDAAALDVADPVEIYKGYADGADISRGRVVIRLDPSASSAQFCPRHRIGPNIGVNFLAPAGYQVKWGESTLVMKPRGS